MDSSSKESLLLKGELPLNKPELSIIVVSYNTSRLTVECIKSIITETRKYSFEIIVFDNASSDDSVSNINLLKDRRIRLFTSGVNHGFAKANNLAFQYVVADRLLLLNPDTVVLNGAIDKLVDFSIENPEAGIWGGKTIFPDGALNPASCWGKQTLWSLFSQAIGFTSIFRKSSVFNPEGLGGWDREGEKQVDIVSGCFLLTNGNTWKKLGGFNNLFFMYGEEADLCLRSHKMNCKPRVTSQATIVHYGGASEKVRADKMIRLLKSKMLLIDQHFSKNLASLAKFLLSCWPLSRYVIHTFLALFSSKFNCSSTSWSEVWSRKNEWQSINDD